MKREELLQIAKPILFSTPMVQAILADKKSMTRRVVILPKWADGEIEQDLDDSLMAICKNTGCLARIKPPHKPGDFLWVRETWAMDSNSQCIGMDTKICPNNSCEDAKAEGLSCLTKDNGITYKYGIPDIDGWPGDGSDIGWIWSEWCVDPRKAYFKLWDNLNKERGFESNKNPWTFVYKFERVIPDAINRDKKVKEIVEGMME